MVGFSRLAHFDHSALARLADWAAVAVAVALPWSTSAVGIAIAVWLVILLPTLDTASVKRELVTAAGGLPVVLWCLGLIGMFWADVSWHDRFAGLDRFHRLLAIPLLLAQFRRSGNGIAVICGFFHFVSCFVNRIYVLLCHGHLVARSVTSSLYPSVAVIAARCIGLVMKEVDEKKLVSIRPSVLARCG